ncbi:hypothetical protein GJ496_008743 [Pomphorhynchus laevis]|nr:hypothetical protein GJ496_008743 [Pomphorhynchus laevis]
MDLPNNNFAVIVGTGIIESMVAAACSLAGKKVLQVDSMDTYGTENVSYTLDHLFKWATSTDSLEEFSSADISPDVIQLHSLKKQFHSAAVKCDHVSSSSESLTNSLAKLFESDNCDMSYATHVLKKTSIDLNPKILFSRDDFIENLVSSEACRYCEFCSVDVVAMNADGLLQKAICSRASIFADKQILYEDKWKIMKLIKKELLTPNDDKTENRPDRFDDFLSERGIKGQIYKYLFESICTCRSLETSTNQALKQGKHFCSSIGIYSESPYIWTTYGSGDLTQAYCRLAAVNGCVYCLNLNCQSLEVIDNKIANLKLNDNTTVCGQHFIINRSYVEHDKPDELHQISRMILITRKSVLSGSTKNIFLHYFPDDSQIAAEILEICIDPKLPLYIVYVAAHSDENRTAAFENIRTWIDDESAMLLQLSYKQRYSSNKCTKLAENCFLASSNNPDENFFFFGNIVDQAFGIFKNILPDNEFMKRADLCDSICDN